MSKYMIHEPDMKGRVWIEDMESKKVFNGYDFMGGVIWEDFGGDGYWAEPDEAEQIVRDLEAADDDGEEPEILTEYQKGRIYARYTDLLWLIERSCDESSCASYSGQLAGIRYVMESIGYHFYHGGIITDSEWYKLTHA